MYSQCTKFFTSGIHCYLAIHHSLCVLVWLFSISCGTDSLALASMSASCFSQICQVNDQIGQHVSRWAKKKLILVLLHWMLIWLYWELIVPKIFLLKMLYLHFKKNQTMTIHTYTFKVLYCDNIFKFGWPFYLILT